MRHDFLRVGPDAARRVCEIVRLEREGFQFREQQPKSSRWRGLREWWRGDRECCGGRCAGRESDRRTVRQDALAMKSIVLLLVAASAAGCASSGSKVPRECAPVPDEFLLAGPAYRDCAVDQKATVTMQPHPSVEGLKMDGSDGCFSAEIDVVIDTL